MTKRGKSSQKKTTSAKPSRYLEEGGTHSYCSLPQVPERVLGPDVNPFRAGLIRLIRTKWVNATVLHYYFFDKDTDGKEVLLSDGTREWRTWTTDDRTKEVVRRAFKVWEDVGIGLEFKEVFTRDQAEIRIGFQNGDGAWSYIGRDVLGIGRDERTMNFGWDLTRHPAEIDTPVHEIGHTLGFPHEHQNPNAGIVWDEEAVYAALAGHPNYWPHDKTYYNIIRKIDANTVQGSDWDPHSIMHYPFRAGLITLPQKYTNGLDPNPGLSDRDKSVVREFYPPLAEKDYTDLIPFQSERMEIAAGEQKNYRITAAATRYYEISTFGESDTVIVLFEDEGDELRYVTADDDSGEDYNSSLRVKLVENHHYVLRVRLYYSQRAGETAVMMW